MTTHTRDWSMVSMRRIDGALAEIRSHVAAIDDELARLRDEDRYDATPKDIEGMGYHVELIEMMAGRLKNPY